MVNNTNNKQVVYVPAQFINSPSTSKVAVNNWCINQGLKSFRQLVIGKGTNPTNSNVKFTNATGKRKKLLANNGMAGKTVAQYFDKCAANGLVPKASSMAANNPLQAAKAGLVTLHLPIK